MKAKDLMDEMHLHAFTRKICTKQAKMLEMDAKGEEEFS